MDGLALFGLLAVTAMLVFRAIEDRSPWYIGVCGSMCAGLDLWLLTRRMAVWSGGSHLGAPRCKSLADQGAEGRGL
jgi:hypothetical protein